MISLLLNADHCMTTPNQHVPLSTGTERMADLVARERIVRERRGVRLEQIVDEARHLATRATLHHTAPLPMPQQDRATAKDLRRGRMHPLGRVLWFLRILKERQHPDARELAERLRDLVSEAIDLELPKVIDQPKEPVRVWRPAARPLMTVMRPASSKNAGRASA